MAVNDFLFKTGVVEMSDVIYQVIIRVNQCSQYVLTNVISKLTTRQINKGIKGKGCRDVRLEGVSQPLGGSGSGVAQCGRSAGGVLLCALRAAVGRVGWAAVLRLRGGGSCVLWPVDGCVAGGRRAGRGAGSGSGISALIINIFIITKHTRARPCSPHPVDSFCLWDEHTCFTVTVAPLQKYFDQFAPAPLCV